MATPKKLLTENVSPMVISVRNSAPGFIHSDHETNTSTVQPPTFLDFLLREVETLVDLSLNKNQKTKLSSSIFIKIKDQIVNLNLKEVLWVEAYGDYVNFFTEKTRYIVHSTMKSIETKLPAEEFMRVHRSFIVRTDKIELIEESLIQIGKKLIPIGESYRNDFFSKLNIL